MKIILTDTQKKYIHAQYLHMSIREMGSMLGLKCGVIQRYMRNEGLVVPKEIVEQFRIKALTGRTTFTPEMDMVIKRDYLTVVATKIGEQIGKSETGVKGRIKALGLVVPDELKQQRKIDGRFKKGNISPTKGKKLSEILTKEGYERVKATHFNKGNVPANAKHDGAISVRTDKRGRQYLFIRIAQGKWRPLHVHLWEQEHGPLPEGFVVVFKDKNRQNCSIENLEMVTREELMERNTIQRYPKELKDAIKLLSKLKKKIDEKQTT